MPISKKEKPIKARKEEEKARIEDTGEVRRARPPKVDPETTRRKKEEQSRTGRRRMRQWLGAAITVLVIAGAISIVQNFASTIKKVTGNEEESAVYERMVTPMVWYDMLPFDSLNQLDEKTLKYITIWEVYLEKKDELGKSENAGMIIPLVDVDRWAATLYGPDFKFTEHITFEDDIQGITYTYDDELKAYILPATGVTPQYIPTIAGIKNESNGIKRVIVGYVSAMDENQQMIINPDTDYPEFYMDYLFQRSGSNHYLVSLQKNTTQEVKVNPANKSSKPEAPSSSSSEPEIVAPPPATDPPPESTSQEPEADSSAASTASAKFVWQSVHLDKKSIFRYTKPNIKFLWEG